MNNVYKLFLLPFGSYKTHVYVRYIMSYSKRPYSVTVVSVLVVTESSYRINIHNLCLTYLISRFLMELRVRLNWFRRF